MLYITLILELVAGLYFYLMINFFVELVNYFLLFLLSIRQLQTPKCNGVQQIHVAVQS